MVITGVTEGVLHRAVRARQGHKPAQSWIPGRIVPADRAALPVTTPGGHLHTPTASATALGLTCSGQPGSPENAYR